MDGTILMAPVSSYARDVRGDSLGNFDKRVTDDTQETVVIRRRRPVQVVTALLNSVKQS